MEKKNYSKPFAAEEVFTPNHYIAACAVEPDIPVGYLRDHFYIDGLDTGSNQCRRHSKDGTCAASTEHINGLMTLDQLSGSLKGKGLQGILDTYKNAHIDQGYYDLTASNACNGQRYTNGSYFAPVIILHPSYNSSQFYFLASGEMTSDNPWDYVTPDMKNQS